MVARQAWAAVLCCCLGGRAQKAVTLAVYGEKTTYDEKTATLAMRLAQASYCPLASNWTCSTCDTEVKPTAVVEETTSDTKGRAVVGIDSRDSTVFISYRGTENINNWIRDADFVRRCPYDSDGVCVEAGFMDWYNALASAGVTEALTEAVDRSGFTRVKTVGHSAGGAVATLFAYDVARGIYGNLTLESIFTFGSPRVGNQHFADSFEALLRDIPSFRVTHYRDIVPQLPPETLWYHHVAREVYYTEDSSKYTICDGSGEDPDCSDSCYLTFICDNVEDHLTYLNISIGIDGC